jgi:RNA polymerase sigma factor (sigma-70 family)
VPSEVHDLDVPFVVDPVLETGARRALVRVDIDRALQEPSPHERVLIALRYEEGGSHPQIARQLQVPEATVHVRLHRVHKRLKLLLQDRP